MLRSQRTVASHCVRNTRGHKPYNPTQVIALLATDITDNPKTQLKYSEASKYLHFNSSLTCFTTICGAIATLALKASL